MAGGLELPTTAAQQDGGRPRACGDGGTTLSSRWWRPQRRDSKEQPGRHAAEADRSDSRWRRWWRSCPPWCSWQLAAAGLTTAAEDMAAASGWLLGAGGRRRSGLRRRRLVSVAAATAAVAVDGGDVGGCGSLARWPGVRQQRLRWR
uniref:DUF834 domain-containing protein n=1 Tax=Oryza meridionalis TaxID=40149 RepID=A0A0E0E2P6_9ORYZ